MIVPDRPNRPAGEPLARIVKAWSVALLAVALGAVPTRAGAQEPKLPTQIQPLPPGARPTLKLPAGVEIVTMRVPIGGDIGGEPAIRVPAPAPFDPEGRADLIPARPRTAAPAPRVPVRPARFVLTAQDPHLDDTASIRFNDAFRYYPTSDPRGNLPGSVSLTGSGSAIELYLYQEEGRRYLIDFGLTRDIPELITLVVQAFGGTSQDVTVHNESFRLVVVTEPAERSGWGVVLVFVKSIQGNPSGETRRDDRVWTFHDVRVRRLD
jgi:hypothetical protein